MITRRHLLGTVGAGVALAVSGLRFSSAETAGGMLTPGVPEGVGSYATMATLPGKKPLISALRHATELRNAARVSPHPNHTERRVLYSLSPG